MKRYLTSYLKKDLAQKMVFLGGPRQVGKTTLAFQLLGTTRPEHPAYLSWDVPECKQQLIKGQLPAGQTLIVLDEIHKYKNWRNLVKGFFDKYRLRHSFLITGSARLDYYRRGGDSLQGRYHYYRLHPLSFDEMSSATQLDLQNLLRFGGFPEPLLAASDRHYKRWQRERKTRVLQEDLMSLESVKDVSSLELLVDLLPTRVGAPLSVANLRQDLSVAFETAERWIQILERLYYCYRLAPYGPAQLKAAKKEKKLYLWDWSLCPSEASRFENLVASHLLKYCHFIEDTEGDVMELCFLRDAMKREIDFVVLKDRKPIFAVECKTGQQSLSQNIRYFAARTPIPQFYQVHCGLKDVEIHDHRTRILPFTRFASLIRTR